MTMRKALVEFHYAADGVNPVRYPAGALVPVKPQHVSALVVQGKILRADDDPEYVEAVQDLAGPHEAPSKARRRRK